MLLQEAPHTTTLSDLSAELAAEVLRHVPQQQRLTQCALVCRTWASAAAVATLHVKCKLTPATAPALQAWLQQHAGQLLTLQLSGRGRISLRLPLHKLKRLKILKLQYFKLQLPGEEVTLSSLQRLQLWAVELARFNSLLQLTAAPQLTSLDIGSCSFTEQEFCGCTYKDNTAAAVERLAAAVPDMLQRLPLLSELMMPDLPLSDAAVQQLAAMQGLRQVSLAHLKHVPVCDLQYLPSSITQLSLLDCRDYGQLPPSLPPRLQQLTGLLHLNLFSCSLPPTLLASVTQLQSLTLEGGMLLPIAFQDDDGPDVGTLALLDVLPKLTRLQELHLQAANLDDTGIAPQRFAALTASSHLTRLVVHSDNGAPLP
jgi:hypothetical protein